MSQPSLRRPIMSAVAAIVLLPAAAYAQSAGSQPVEGWLERPAAILQGLDKVTARISEFAAPVEIPVRFNTLSIRVRACRTRPPTMPPESAAFLEIDEAREDERPTPLFRGWMFASSPGLNALEHPVYDVWVLSCSKDDTAGQSSSQ